MPEPTTTLAAAASSLAVTAAASPLLYIAGVSTGIEHAVIFPAMVGGFAGLMFANKAGARGTFAKTAVKFLLAMLLAMYFTPPVAGWLSSVVPSMGETTFLVAAVMGLCSQSIVLVLREELPQVLRRKMKSLFAKPTVGKGDKS
jgi:hypothetical protein